MHTVSRVNMKSINVGRLIGSLPPAPYTLSPSALDAHPALRIYMTLHRSYLTFPTKDSEYRTNIANG